MIEAQQLYNVNYYKSAAFTGSLKHMHYRVIREETETDPVFCVTIWPGPYNFDTTPDEKKKNRTFPFTNEALRDIASYLNDVYRAEYQ